MKKIGLMAFLLSTALFAQENQVKLNESVITSQNFGTTVRDTASNITIITAKEIESKGATNLIDALRMAPGVTAQTYYGDIKFNVGGYFPIWAQNNTVVTLDGVKIDQKDASNIPVNSIERIEVIPNGGGILYGDGAAGGIINIITKNTYGNDKNKLINGNVSLEFANEKSYKYALATTVKATDKISLGVEYSNKHLNSWRRTTAKNDLTSTYEHISVNGNYKDNTNDINLKYTRNNTHYEYGYDIDESDYKKDRKMSYGKGANTNYQSDNLYASYRGKLSDNMEILTYGDLLKKTYKDKNKIKYKEIFDRNIRAQVKYLYDVKDYFIVGTDYQNTVLKPINKATGKRTGKNSRKEELGIFVINENNFGNLTFAQGFRYGHSEYDYYYRDGKRDDYIPKHLRGKNKKEKFNNWAGELELRDKYSETGMAYAKLSRTFRTPLAMEMDHTVDGKKLDTQIQNTVEFGVKDYLWDNFYTSASIYYKQTEGEIYYQAYSNKKGQQTFPYYNIGDTRRIGIDLLSEQYLGKFTLTETLTYLNHKIVKSSIEARKGKEIPFVPNWKAGFGVNYKYSNKLNLDTSIVYVGKYFDSDDPENIRAKDCGGYTTVDVSANYKFDNGLSVVARVNNLFDAHYADYVGQYYGTERQIDPAIGRNFSVGFDYKF